MKIQNSYEAEHAGKLYIVPTPIGNLEDMTYRAVQTLKDVDLIAAEDTRHTQKLLNHFEIEKRMISYHEHNRKEREAELLNLLTSGQSLALVSDAGMPAISDPGSELVQAAIEADIAVVVLPGANAAICALVASGLATEEFLFYGFLPRKKKTRTVELERLVQLKSTLIFYESPHRIKEVLVDLDKVFGSEAKIVLARELTKRFEQFMRGTIEEAIAWSENDETQIRGEFVVVVEGVEKVAEVAEAAWWESLSIQSHVTEMIETGLSAKDAIKLVSKERVLGRREVYQAYHGKKM